MFKKFFGALVALSVIFGGLTLIGVGPASALTCDYLGSGGGQNNLLVTAGTATGNYVQAAQSTPSGYQNHWCFQVEGTAGSGAKLYELRPMNHSGGSAQWCVTDSTSDNSIKLEVCNASATNELWTDVAFNGTTYLLENDYDGTKLDDPSAGGTLHHVVHSNTNYFGTSPNDSYDWLQF